MFERLKEWWANHGNWQPKTALLILGFILLLFFVLSHEADAAEVKPETRVELAPTLFVAGNRYNGVILSLEERWQNKYAVGLGLTTSWVCSEDCRRGPGEQNQFVYVQRVVRYKKHFEMGLGISYWHNTSPSWNSNTPYALHLGWNFNKKLAIKWRHFSTGGTSSQNAGLDYLTISYNFK